MTADASKDIEKEEHSSLLVGLQAGTTTLEISLAVPQKIGHSTTRKSSNTFPGNKSNVLTYNKDTCSTIFIAAIVAISGCQLEYIWNELQSRIGRLTSDPYLEAWR